MRLPIRPIMAALILLPMLASAQDQPKTWSWQKPHAKVLPTGDLQWAPQPFAYQADGEVRYIDFANGDDANPGTRAKPWKHHPWDPAATANAKNGGQADTFVFKRGVIYRGTLAGKGVGSAKIPVRLTADPNWGSGEAIIAGSEPLTDGWKRCDASSAPKGMPDPTKVWVRDLPDGDRPWTLWQATRKDGKLTSTRLKLARTPNWDEDDPEDLHADWWTWQRCGQRQLGKKNLNFGTDRQHLTFPQEAIDDAYVYSEWGPVMGTPVAREITRYDRKKNTIYFPGFWGGGAVGMFGKMRYYLENAPHFLDEPGEWWYADKGPHKGKLFVRLPDDANPNDAHLELGRAGTVIQLASGSRHVRISNLAFRWTNVGTPHLRPFTKWRDYACIRLVGSGSDLRVRHCSFKHVHRAVKLKAVGGEDVIDRVVIADNDIAHTRRGAIEIADGGKWRLRTPPRGELGEVKVLRNRLHRIGFRPPRGEHGHAVTVSFPETAEIAGNMLSRCYGAGLFVFGGKSSGYLGDVPLSRILIHHNRVVQPLLNTNDWGGIETWQGGPHYVFNNVSGNPNGYWNFARRRFGFAYYLDGSFKNYLFNNIAWGISSEKGPHGNTSAFQEIHSYQNTFFHNSAFRFVVGSRRQAPQAGRDLFVSNIWDDMGEWVFWHAKPPKDPDQANEAHVGKVGGHFAYHTGGYARNVFHRIGGNLAVFEATGRYLKTLDQLHSALRHRNALARDAGVMAKNPVFRDAEKHDFRPAKNSAAIGRGARVFVPWPLYATVAEWNFRINRADPNTLIDDHWYMRPYYDSRETYHHLPHVPLTARNVTAADYIDGPLESWTRGALRFNGKDQSARITHEQLTREITYTHKGKTHTVAGTDRISLDMAANSFTIEAYLRTANNAKRGSILAKAGQSAGYLLRVSNNGAPEIVLRAGEGRKVNIEGKPINDGKWHHLLVEVDRPTKIARIYVDGELTGRGSLADLTDGSLSNPADVLLGVGPGDDYFAGAIDFLRVSRGTLADAKTTIDELRAWQFAGPQFADFLGQPRPDGAGTAGAIQSAN
ncbi:MAG: LamG-like jellyroll fold domain-containing protein [Planctomycetota bacterium]